MGEVEEVLVAAGAEGESSMAVGIAFVMLDMQGADGNGIRDPTTYDTRPPGRSIFWINDPFYDPDGWRSPFLCIYDVQYLTIRHSSLCLHLQANGFAPSFDSTR